MQPFVQRMIEEYKELSERLKKLIAFQKRKSLTSWLRNSVSCLKSRGKRCHITKRCSVSALKLTAGLPKFKPAT